MAAKKKATNKEKRESTNPFTGKKANQFTEVTNVSLPAPVVKRPKKETEFEAKRRRTDTASSKAKFTEVYEGDNSPIDPSLGYRFVEPENVPALRDGSLKSASGGTVTPQLVGWLAGAHRAFPNNSTGPAINEPHEAAPHEVVPRRLEDLSGNEVEHMNKVMEQYGYPKSSPEEKVNTLGNIQMRNMLRVLSEHAVAGVEENSRQLFYGGTPTTGISDPEMHSLHTEKMLESQKRFNAGASGVMAHPEFAKRFGNLPAHKQTEIARTMEATALADTSPNSKWHNPGTNRWPNMEQGEEAINAYFEGRAPNFVSGRVQNNAKAVRNVGSISELGPEALREMRRTPKTTPFRSALIDPDSPDAYTVTDIHEGSQIAPHLTTAKSLEYIKPDEHGDKIGSILAVHPGQTVPRGYKPRLSDEGKQTRGNSRVEDMLAKSGGTIHAANDYATRKVNAELGISRGINYTDNTHAGQAARWGSQQQIRPDVQVSHADLYPVIRNWGAEGVGMARPSWMPENSGQWGALFEEKTTSPAWAENPNTNYEKNATKKPFLM